MTAPPFSSATPRFRWRTVAVALLLYGIFLAACAPASVLAWALTYWTNGVISLEGAQGSVWRGHAAALVIAGPAGRALRFEGLRWEWVRDLRSASEPAFRVHLDGRPLQGLGRVAFRTRGIRVGDAAFRAPASALAAYVPQLSTVGLSGELSLVSDEFTFGDNDFGGAARVQWRNAATALTTGGPLGEYRAIVSGTGTSAQLRIETAGGALRVEARGAWSPERGLSLEGTAWAVADRRAELSKVLSMVGPERGNGIHRFGFGGNVAMAGPQ
jgi:general secretion pathway protein N